MKLIVRRTAGIGDSLAATVVADLLHEQGHEVVWQCHQDVTPIIKRHPTIVRVEPPVGHCDVNLDGCYEHSVSGRIAHFHHLFIAAANVQLEQHHIILPINQIPQPPKLNRVPKNEQAISMRLGLRPLPWIMIVPRSNFLTRGLPDAVWSEACNLFNGVPIWLGQHPAPMHAVNSKCSSGDIALVADHIACADLVVTVDTGPMHIASAYDIPMVVISQSHDVHLRLSPLNDFEIVKRNDLDCLNCQRHRCPIDPYNPPCGQIDPKELADVVNRKLKNLEPSNPIAA